MQFHLNGFEPGDPDIHDPADRFPATGTSGTLPEEVDVLIVGCGPAGLTLAAQLSAFPDINTRIVEQKSGPLLLGQADGDRLPHDGDVQRLWLCRARAEGSLLDQRDDVLEAGRRASRSNIVRSGRVQDVEDGLSEFPHVILNQARVHDFYLDVMRNSPSRLEPDYARRLIDLQIDRSLRRRRAHPIR